MEFTDDDFIDLLDFCRNLSNFPPTAKKAFDHIGNISKSETEPYAPLINDLRYWLFNLDNICFNVRLRDNGHEKPNRPASTDGLHYIKLNSKIKLYFIEFKGLPINSIDYKEKLSSIIDILKDNKCIDSKDNCPLSEEVFKSLTNVKNRFEDEIICQLKIKTNETLFFVLPMMYEYYCRKMDLEYDLNIFITWLLMAKKKFIVVFDDEEELSISNKHFSFENKLRLKFNHFQNIANITPIVVSKSNFEEEYLQNEFEEISFPA